MSTNLTTALDASTDPAARLAAARRIIDARVSRGPGLRVTPDERAHDDDERALYRAGWRWERPAPSLGGPATIWAPVVGVTDEER